MILYYEEINNEKEKYLRYYFIYLIIIHSFFFIVILYNVKQQRFSPYSPNIKSIKIGNGSYAKIGIISDLHLSYDSKNKKDIFSYSRNNTYIALKYFKKVGIDILIIVGDLIQNNQLTNLIYFKKILYSVYKDIYRPIIITLMGNHDYDINNNNIESQKIFYKLINSCPYSHYLINGYNFIFFSQKNTTINKETIKNYSWLKNQLDISLQMTKKKGDPIFVFTHIPPKDTVYGSEILGTNEIYSLLNNYHQVICISGHSHHSMKNIKSIWQGNFTVINTQSISFINPTMIYII